MVGGQDTLLGRQLLKIPQGVPLKYLVAIKAVVASIKEPNAKMLSAIMDREDGKPSQPLDVGGIDKIIVTLKGEEDE